ncbi:MAG: hypothetical protein WC155_08135 [Candidatus Cloacimonadales bacterium]
MTFTEIILALLPFITLALIIFIVVKLGKPINWLEVLGRYSVSKKQAQQTPKVTQTNDSPLQTKTYHISISINKADE